MEELTDEIIARRVQAGDTKAFGMLVRRYEEKLLRYARKFLLAPHDAEDVVQEVFLKAYVNIKSFDTDQRFSPWIYRIAHNEFINAIKKRKKPLPLFDLDTLFPHLFAKEDADSGASREELKTMLDAGLKNLSPKYREPLILYYFEELNYQEIANILHIPVSTIGVRLKRGKAQLANIIAKRETYGK